MENVTLAMLLSGYKMDNSYTFNTPCSIGNTNFIRDQMCYSEPECRSNTRRTWGAVLDVSNFSFLYLCALIQCVLE